MKCSTQVPNILFDEYLCKLTESELKILLVIVRQTYGWMDKQTGNRKTKDRISRSQFMQKAGLSRRIVSKTLKTLSERGLITITDRNDKTLISSLDRRGKSFLFYSLQPVHFTTSTSAQSVPRPVHKGYHNKRNDTKENITKERRLPFKTNNGISIGEAIQKFGYLRKFGLDNS